MLHVNLPSGPQQDPCRVYLGAFNYIRRPRPRQSTFLVASVRINYWIESMPSTPPPAVSQVRALVFDVFGTVVDWRSSVTEELASCAARKAASSPSSSTALGLLSREDWAVFAQEWRDTYKAFVKGFVPGKTPWKDIDAHHLDSLCELLRARGLDNVYSSAETIELSRVWHRLRPWQDSSAGIFRLGSRFVTSTLSNGNRTLLQDLDKFGSLGFHRLLSAEDFKRYKPHPDVYLGAVSELGLQEACHVALVAAHLSDLKAAKGVGMRTIYVERPAEEDWEEHEARYEDARDWVDVWIPDGGHGFLDLAEALGVP